MASAVESPGASRQKGAALFLVLSVGVVIALVLFAVLRQSGWNRKDSVKKMVATKEFYLADAGFNWLKTKITSANRSGGTQAVDSLLASVKGGGWRLIQFGAEKQGYFRLKSYQVTPQPLSVDMAVEGRRDTKDTGRGSPETVAGMVRVPSLARYARYIEGNSTLTYNSGTLVDGEILVAGDINLISSPVHFTRLVSTGSKILNRTNGQYDFGFKEGQVDIPTLNDVHVNAWDNYPAGFSDTKKTFEFMSQNGGIYLYGPDPVSKNPPWIGLNEAKPCSQSQKGPCDTLFTTCFDTLSRARRSPTVVLGSAVALDLSSISISGGKLSVTVSPVVYDAGPDGKNYFVLGKPSRTYTRNYNTFKNNAVIYFPGDLYVTGQLRAVPVTLVAGDDVFLYGGWIGPRSTEVDANNMPVTLGIIAQDRIFIHEAAPRDITLRAAMLAENDEITYTQSNRGPSWKYGYVCTREIYAPARMPKQGDVIDYKAYFKQNFIWDNHRVEFAGVGREPDEECVSSANCPNSSLNDFGFVALGYPRPAGSNWSLKFEGALITRQPGSKGPSNSCNMGWDCDSDPKRSTWRYDDNLGVAYPPKFPAPVVNDRNPTQVLGYKRKGGFK